MDSLEKPALGSVLEGSSASLPGPASSASNLSLKTWSGANSNPSTSTSTSINTNTATNSTRKPHSRHFDMFSSDAGSYDLWKPSNNSSAIGNSTTNSSTGATSPASVFETPWVSSAASVKSLTPASPVLSVTSRSSDHASSVSPGLVAINTPMLGAMSVGSYSPDVYGLNHGHYGSSTANSNSHPGGIPIGSAAGNANGSSMGIASSVSSIGSLNSFNGSLSLSLSNSVSAPVTHSIHQSSHSHSSHSGSGLSGSHSSHTGHSGLSGHIHDHVLATPSSASNTSNSTLGHSPADLVSSATSTSATSTMATGTPGTGSPVDDELIPTAIVIKNIPFAIKKEQLLEVMTSLNLPLPYAFNYHFDNGVFRGLAFANFTSAKETAAVISLLNGREIGGRKLRVEYKKMLPLAERERIEREKRERRGQLEEQHRPKHSNNHGQNHGHNNQNNNHHGTTTAQSSGLDGSAANGSTPTLATTNHLRSFDPHGPFQGGFQGPFQGPPGPSGSNTTTTTTTTTGSKNKKDDLHSASKVDLNDPETLDFYSQLLLFRDDKARGEFVFSTPLASHQRKTVIVLCSQLGLVFTGSSNGNDKGQILITKPAQSAAATPQLVGSPATPQYSHFPSSTNNNNNNNSSNNAAAFAHSHSAHDMNIHQPQPQYPFLGPQQLRGTRSYADIRAPMSQASSPFLHSQTPPLGVYGGGLGAHADHHHSYLPGQLPPHLAAPRSMTGQPHSGQQQPPPHSHNFNHNFGHGFGPHYGHFGGAGAGANLNLNLNAGPGGHYDVNSLSDSFTSTLSFPSSKSSSPAVHAAPARFSGGSSDTALGSLDQATGSLDK